MEISVMTKILTAASVLAIAGAASAAQFQFLAVAAGGNGAQPGVAGAGFTAVGGSFFHDLGFGGNTAESLNPLLFDVFPQIEFDTYSSISAIGPAVGGTSAVTRNFYGDLAGVNSNNVAPFALVVSAGSVSNGTNMFFGLGIQPQPYNSGFAPNVGGGRSTNDGVFLGRYTVSNNGSISGGARMSLKDIGDPATYQAEVTIGGGPVQIGAFQYELIPFVVADVTQGRVHDLWLVQIPTPGALALFGLGGVAAIRRRRA